MASSRRRNGGGSSTGAGGSGMTATNSLSDRLGAPAQIWARGRLQAWGRFVATHQITVLLLCCVVLCTLTYPVLSVYAWSARSSSSATSDFFSFLRTSSIPTWDLVVGADGSIARSTARDIKLPWKGLDALVVNAEEACWQRIPKFREITVQQLLVGLGAESRSASEHGVLDRRALHSVHKLEQRLHERLLLPANATARPSLTCAKLASSDVEDDSGSSRSEGHQAERCFSLSPMAYWSNDENVMLSDTSLIATVNGAGHAHYRQLPLHQDDLFVGRVYAGTTMRKADYAVITLFLQEAPSAEQINDLVAPLAKEYGLALVERSKADSRAVMKHRSDVRIRADAWEDIFFFAGYAIVLLYIYLTLRRLNRVHSKSGLVVTGAVQMVVSGMMSMSICALAGYKINLVPWKLIPFLIVVLGVDNMFVLTNAVSNTSLNLPVRERIAEGLGQSGVSIFVNLGVELLSLCILYVGIPTRVIREMVVFGAIALVVDYAMEMTYFLTVLSIDMQRLELADFLSQGLRTESEPVNGHEKQSSSRSGKSGSIASFAEGFFRSIRERRARTYTAIFLVGSNYLLYLLFGPEYFVPAFCSNLDFAEGPQIDRTPGAPQSPSEAFWHLLGARPTEPVHIHVSTPAVLLFDSPMARQGVTSMARLAHNAASLWSFVKFVVVPISITTVALYFVLVQLLKGSERLNKYADEQSHAATPDIEVEDVYDEQQRAVAALIAEAGMLSCLTIDSYRASDVELLASTADGLATASWVPVEQCIRLTFATDPSSPSLLPLIGVLRRREVLTHLSLNDQATFCAFSTNQKRFLAWPLVHKALPLDLTSLATAGGATSAPTRSKVLAISAEKMRRQAAGSPPLPRTGASSPFRLRAAFFTLQQDGSVVRWDCIKRQSTIVVPAAAGAENGKTALLEHPELQQPLVTRSSQPDRLEIWRCVDGEYGIWRILTSAPQSPGTSTDSVTSQALIPSGDRLSIALGRSSGAIEVWDVQDQLLLYSSKDDSVAMPIAERPVQQIRLVNTTGCRCSACGVLFSENITVVAGTNSDLAIVRLSAEVSGPCECGSSTSPSLSPQPSMKNLKSAQAGNGMVYSGSFGQRRSPIRNGGLDDASHANSTSSSTTLSYPLSPHAMRRMSHAASDRKKAAAEAMQQAHSGPQPARPTSPTTTRNGGHELVSGPVASASAYGAHSRESSAANSLGGTSISENGHSPSIRIPWRAEHLGAIKLDSRGAWSALGSSVVGVRRAKQARGAGLLARWESWSFALDQAPSTSLAAAVAVAGYSLDTLVSMSSSALTQPYAQLPFDRIRHFYVTLDGSKVVTALGNLVISSTPEDVPPAGHPAGHTSSQQPMVGAVSLSPARTTHRKPSLAYPPQPPPPSSSFLSPL